MTVVNAAQPPSAVALAPAHARLARRIQAAAIDVLVHGATLIVLMSLLELLVHGQRPVTGAAFVVWLGFALLYEPVLVWRRGATLGHAVVGLRVLDLETGGSPSAARAFARFWLKATAGTLGAAVIALTGRPHALHDLAVGTCVEEHGE
jgi:uncharacterized RDD family membrane protein YckC